MVAVSDTGGDEQDRTKSQGEQERRATVLASGDSELWVAAERLPQLRAIHPDALLTPAIEAPYTRAARSA